VLDSLFLGSLVTLLFISIGLGVSGALEERAEFTKNERQNNWGKIMGARGREIRDLRKGPGLESMETV
jgi:hypothetical protein